MPDQKKDTPKTITPEAKSTKSTVRFDNSTLLLVLAIVLPLLIAIIPLYAEVGEIKGKMATQNDVSDIKQQISEVRNIQLEENTAIASFTTPTFTVSRIFFPRTDFINLGNQEILSLSLKDYLFNHGITTVYDVATMQWAQSENLSVTYNLASTQYTGSLIIANQSDFDSCSSCTVTATFIPFPDSACDELGVIVLPGSPAYQQAISDWVNDPEIIQLACHNSKPATQISLTPEVIPPPK